MRGKALLSVLVISLFVVSGCRSQSTPSIVGSWRHWEGVLLVEFMSDGEVIYDVDTEDFVLVERGTYQLLEGDRILIDVGYPPSGEFSYEIQGDVLELVDASGRKQIFNRVK
jgi:hypothetical protein